MFVNWNIVSARLSVKASSGRRPRVGHHRQRAAEQDGEDDDLQHVVLGDRARDVLRKDVEDEGLPGAIASRRRQLLRFSRGPAG
jgi:hypothetical protein